MAERAAAPPGQRGSRRHPGAQLGVAAVSGEACCLLAAVLVLPAGLLWLDRAGPHGAESLISVPGISIAGGTDEIQRTIIAERILGLPREPDISKDLPFRHVRAG
jgi:hypothetical protein